MTLLTTKSRIQGHNPTLRHRLHDTPSPVGSMVFEFFVPGLAQAAHAAGADFLILDTEHSSVGVDTIKAQCATCNGVGIVPIVRVADYHYHLIAGALDAGAHGVMVPMVGTPEQARAVVAASHYPPAGRRGSAFGIAHDGYLAGSPREKVAVANERTIVIAMIETPEGLENVDSIAAVSGVDVLWLGHFDLTNFMGIPGEFDHPSYLSAVTKISDSARRNGKVAGIMAADVTWATRYFDLGYRLFAYGLDVHLYQSALRTGISAVRALHE